ncbi:hypothetical protein [Peribacillus acanthi]|uniref:hypothetical protein n=1 Tax=Peribacillus acanthi TaxID=2171554 RepID=UPI000D3E1AAA|nr:hypothetical protein [Peribacillus acanthi]
MKGLYKISISILAALLLTACGSEQTEDVQKEVISKEPVTNEETDSDSSDKETSGEDSSSKDSEEVTENDSEKAVGSDSSLPKTKDLEVHVEGQIEKRPATLNESELGYYIYVLDNFNLDAEEPNKDILTSTYDDSFFARIEKLSPDTDLSKIKKNLLDSYKGKAIEEDPKKLFLKSFHDAEFYIITEENSDVRTSVIYVGKKFNNHPYVLTVFLPAKEAAEGLGPNMWAMLESIQNKK